MFGLGWCVVVEVWSGVGNINFPHENGLVWVWLGSQPTCRVTKKPFLSTAVAADERLEDGKLAVRLCVAQNHSPRLLLLAKCSPASPIPRAR